MNKSPLTTNIKLTIDQVLALTYAVETGIAYIDFNNKNGNPRPPSLRKELVKINKILEDRISSF